jgi:glycosyltransferase involved in cell wall biosynthesis
MDQKPLVSISCITYNHAPFIKQALDSFLIQKTTFPFEIIIHDDASTDGTKEIIEEYTEKYPKIIFPYFQTENQYSKGVRGMSAKYNFPRCKGKYIAMCEGDDYWTNYTKLQQQVEYLENNETCAGSFHETQQIFQNTNALGKIYGHQAADKLYAEDTISTLSPFHTSSFIFRQSAYFDPGFLAEIDSLDMATFSIISKSGYLKKIPEIMSMYRKHDGSITNSLSFIGRFHENRILLIHYLNKLHNNQYQQKVDEVIAVHRKAIAQKYQGELNQNTDKTTDDFHSHLNLQELLPIFQENSTCFKGEALEIGMSSSDSKYFLFSNTLLTKYSFLDIANIEFPKNLNRVNNKTSQYQLPFSDSSFDNIVCMNFSPNTIYIKAFLKECQRLLRPSGYMLIVILNSEVQMGAIKDSTINNIKKELSLNRFTIIKSEAKLKNTSSSNIISALTSRISSIFKNQERNKPNQISTLDNLRNNFSSYFLATK